MKGRPFTFTTTTTTAKKPKNLWLQATKPASKPQHTGRSENVVLCRSLTGLDFSSGHGSNDLQKLLLKNQIVDHQYTIQQYLHNLLHSLHIFDAAVQDAPNKKLFVIALFLLNELDQKAVFSSYIVHLSAWYFIPCCNHSQTYCGTKLNVAYFELSSKMKKIKDPSVHISVKCVLSSMR